MSYFSTKKKPQKVFEKIVWALRIANNVCRMLIEDNSAKQPNTSRTYNGQRKHSFYHFNVASRSTFIGAYRLIVNKLKTIVFLLFIHLI